MYFNMCKAKYMITKLYDWIVIIETKYLTTTLTFLKLFLKGDGLYKIVVSMGVNQIQYFPLLHSKEPKLCNRSYCNN